MRNQVNNKDLTKVLSTQIKAGLQICHNTLDKSKYPEREYRLFNSLAELYLIKEEAREYPKAAAIYQYLRKLVEKHLNGDQEKLAAIDRRIKAVESRFLEKVKVPKRDLKNEKSDNTGIDSCKEELAELREEVKKELAAIEDLGKEKDKEELNEEGLQKRAQEVERIHMGIREFFIGKRNEADELIKPGLVNRLVEDCIKQLGGLPRVSKDNHECSYAIFGMGSLALGTMTPWSDLEFGILIEEGLAKEEEIKVKEYVRNLTILLHIKVINFGETPLRMTDIEELNNFKLTEKSDPERNWFYDDLTKSGFSFDGPHWHACKTPLGRRGYQGHKDFELIDTPSRIVTKYQDDVCYKFDVQLAQALTTIVLIQGNIELFSQYKDKLKGDKNKKLRKKKAEEILKQDFTKYDPINHFIPGKEGAKYNIKKEIYRFPDRAVAALLNYFNITDYDGWKFLKNTDLKITFSIAAELRLRTYSFFSKQFEDIWIFESNSKESVDNTEDNISFFYFKNFQLIRRFYHTIFALEFSNGIEPVVGNSLSKLNNKPFKKEDDYTEFLIHMKFMRYQKAKQYIEAWLKNYEEFLSLKQRNNKQYIQKWRQFCEVIQGNDYLDFLARTKSMMRYKAKQYVQEWLVTAVNENTHSKIQKKKAKKYEDSWKEFCKTPFTLKLLAHLYNRNVYVCIKLNDWDAAKKYNQKLKDIANKYFLVGEQINSLIYSAVIFQEQGSFQEAINNLEKAKKILNMKVIKKRLIVLYENEESELYNGFLLEVLHNKAVIYKILGEYNKALSVYYELERECFKEKEKKNTPEHAVLLHNKAACYLDKGEYGRALKYCSMALELQKRLFGELHPDYADSLLIQGNILLLGGEAQKALKIHLRAERIAKKVFEGNNSRRTPHLINIGNSYRVLGQLRQAEEKSDEAKEQFDKAVEQYNKIISYYNGKESINRKQDASALNNLGTIYMARIECCVGEEQQNLKKAQKLFKDTLEIRKEALGDNHLDYASTLNNLGYVYFELGDIKKAFYFYFDAVSIYMSKFAQGEITRQLYDYRYALRNFVLICCDANLDIFLENNTKYHATIGFLEKAVEFELVDEVDINEFNKKTILAPVFKHMCESQSDSLNLCCNLIAYYLLIKLHCLHNAREHTEKALKELQATALSLKGTESERLALYLYDWGCMELESQKLQQRVILQLNSFLQSSIFIITESGNVRLPHNHIGIICGYYFEHEHLGMLRCELRACFNSTLSTTSIGLRIALSQNDKHIDIIMGYLDEIDFSESYTTRVKSKKEYLGQELSLSLC